MFVSRRRRVLSATSDVDALAYFSAASITDPTEKAAVNTLFRDLKSASLWTKISCLWPVSSTSQSAALYDAKRLVQMTAVNAPIYSQVRGIFELDGGTNYLDTNFKPASSSGTLVSTTAGSFGVWAASVNGFDGIPFGCTDNVTQEGYFMEGGSALSGWVAQPTGTPATGSLISGSGPFIVTRNGTTVNLYDGADISATASISGTAATNQNLFIGALNSLGTANSHFPFEFSFGFAGGALSDAEVQSLMVIVPAYLGAMGKG